MINKKNKKLAILFLLVNIFLLNIIFSTFVYGDTEKWTSPVYEFQDGLIAGNIYYKFSDGRWQWSYYTKYDWNDVQIKEGLPEINHNLVNSLVGQDFEQGVRVLTERTAENNEGSWFGRDAKLVVHNGDSRITFNHNDLIDTFVTRQLEGTPFQQSPPPAVVPGQLPVADQPPAKTESGQATDSTPSPTAQQSSQALTPNQIEQYKSELGKMDLSQLLEERKKWPDDNWASTERQLVEGKIKEKAGDLSSLSVDDLEKLKQSGLLNPEQSDKVNKQISDLKKEKFKNIYGPVDKYEDLMKKGKIVYSSLTEDPNLIVFYNGSYYHVNPKLEIRPISINEEVEIDGTKFKNLNGGVFKYDKDKGYVDPITGQPIAGTQTPDKNKIVDKNGKLKDATVVYDKDGNLFVHQGNQFCKATITNGVVTANCNEGNTKGGYYSSCTNTEGENKNYDDNCITGLCYKGQCLDDASVQSMENYWNDINGLISTASSGAHFGKQLSSLLGLNFSGWTDAINNFFKESVLGQVFMEQESLICKIPDFPVNPESSVIVGDKNNGWQYGMHIEGAKSQRGEFVEEGVAGVEYTYMVSYKAVNTNEDENYYNLVFIGDNGQQEYFSSAKVIESGSGVNAIETSALIATTSNNYNKVCLRLSYAIEDHNGNKRDQVCNVLVEEPEMSVPVPYSTEESTGQGSGTGSGQSAPEVNPNW
jgi:hypothetical protein